MSFCKPCAEAADDNRRIHDIYGYAVDLFVDHPTNCGCPCAHMFPVEWEKMYLCERPKHETQDS